MFDFRVLLLGAGPGLRGQGAIGLGWVAVGSGTGSSGLAGSMDSGTTLLVGLAMVSLGRVCSVCLAGNIGVFMSLGGVGTKGRIFRKNWRFLFVAWLDPSTFTV